jgi:hypothetical protein
LLTGVSYADAVEDDVWAGVARHGGALADDGGRALRLERFGDGEDKLGICGGALLRCDNREKICFEKILCLRKVENSRLKILCLLLEPLEASS